MLSEEIKFSFKYLLIMIIPACLAYWGGTELIDFLFEEQSKVSAQEIVSKAITIVFAISLIRFYKKEDAELYKEVNYATPLILTFNAVLYIFLVALTLLAVKSTFNFFENGDAFLFQSYLGFGFNLLILTILTIVNLTKNIKYFGDRA